MRTFDYSAINDKQKLALDTLNALYTALEQTIDELAPTGRRKSLALTNLEQSSMWVNKSISKGE